MKKDDAMYRGNSHKEGGIDVVVDGEKPIEVEGYEYKICRGAYESPDKISRTGTNKEVLDFIHGEFSCNFEQPKAESGDFILCKLVVLDKEKKKREGTVKEILDEMQAEKNCRVSNQNKQVMEQTLEKGGKAEGNVEVHIETGDDKDTQKIEQAIAKVSSAREAYTHILNNFIPTITSIAPPASTVYARTKTTQSILNKLAEKKLVNSECPKKGLTDLIGFTLAVETLEQLNQIRKLIEVDEIFGKPIETEDFYDKPLNGYRAIHYLLWLPTGSGRMPIELQLKTRRMKELNKASHEPYKRKALNAEKMDELAKLTVLADEGNVAAQDKWLKTFSPVGAVEKMLYKEGYARGGTILSADAEPKEIKIDENGLPFMSFGNDHFSPSTKEIQTSIIAWLHKLGVTDTRYSGTLQTIIAEYEGREFQIEFAGRIVLIMSFDTNTPLQYIPTAKGMMGVAGKKIKLITGDYADTTKILAEAIVHAFNRAIEENSEIEISEEMLISDLLLPPTYEPDFAHPQILEIALINELRNNGASHIISSGILNGIYFSHGGKRFFLFDNGDEFKLDCLKPSVYIDQIDKGSSIKNIANDVMALVSRYLNDDKFYTAEIEPREEGAEADSNFGADSVVEGNISNALRTHLWEAIFHAKNSDEKFALGGSTKQMSEEELAEWFDTPKSHKIKVYGCPLAGFEYDRVYGLLSQNDEVAYFVPIFPSGELNFLVPAIPQYKSDLLTAVNNFLSGKPNGVELLPFSDDKLKTGGAVGAYEIEVEAVPNYDFERGSHEATIRVPKQKIAATSIDEARDKVHHFILKHDLGGGNFPSAKLFKDGKQIGTISYNGRVWNNDGTEMQFEFGGSIPHYGAKTKFGTVISRFRRPLAVFAVNIKGKSDAEVEKMVDGCIADYIDTVMVGEDWAFLLGDHIQDLHRKAAPHIPTGTPTTDYPNAIAITDKDVVIEGDAEDGNEEFAKGGKLTDKEKQVVEHLKKEFTTITGIPSERGTYDAVPHFVNTSVNAKNMMAVEDEVNGIRFRYRQYSPSFDTKAYFVDYEIINEEFSRGGKLALAYVGKTVFTKDIPNGKVEILEYTEPNNSGFVIETTPNGYIGTFLTKLFPSVELAQKHIVEKLNYAAGGEIQIGKMYFAEIPVDRDKPEGAKRFAAVDITGKEDGKFWAKEVDGKDIFLFDASELKTSRELVLLQMKGDRDTKLKAHGFDVVKLTDEQKYLIEQPDEAPENFYQDGELNFKDALAWWKEQMKRAGLDAATIKKAVKYQFASYEEGGELTADKAKQILKDGTAHGHPLTRKQKRYFGWIAGGRKKYSNGGNVDLGLLKGLDVNKISERYDKETEKVMEARADRDTLVEAILHRVKNTSDKARSKYIKTLKVGDSIIISNFSGIEFNQVYANRNDTIYVKERDTDDAPYAEPVSAESIFVPMTEQFEMGGSTGQTLEEYLRSIKFPRLQRLTHFSKHSDVLVMMMDIVDASPQYLEIYKQVATKAVDGFLSRSFSAEATVNALKPITRTAEFWEALITKSPKEFDAVAPNILTESQIETAAKILAAGILGEFEVDNSSLNKYLLDENLKTEIGNYSAERGKRKFGVMMGNKGYETGGAIEMDEDDCAITSNGFKYSVSCGGKFLKECSEMDEALEAVQQWKDENKWFPNTWFVSDHGNAWLIDEEGNEIKYERGGEVQEGDRVTITTSSLGEEYIGMSGIIMPRKLLNDKYSVKLENGMELAFSKNEFKHNSVNPKYVKGGAVSSFIQELKKSGGHFLDKTLTAQGDTMIYYREHGSMPTDVKTKVFNKSSLSKIENIKDREGNFTVTYAMTAEGHVNNEHKTRHFTKWKAAYDYAKQISRHGAYISQLTDTDNSGENSSIYFNDGKEISGAESFAKGGNVKNRATFKLFVADRYKGNWGEYVRGVIEDSSLDVTYESSDNNENGDIHIIVSGAKDDLEAMVESYTYKGLITGWEKIEEYAKGGKISSSDAKRLKQIDAELLDIGQTISVHTDNPNASWEEGAYEELKTKGAALRAEKEQIEAKYKENSGDSLAASAYKNGYELNRAIERLIDKKNSDKPESYSSEEKRFIANYSGMGGFEKYGATGKGLLYEYFTPDAIVQKMWALAYKNGFSGGSVLEPSVGVGAFIKYAGENCDVTGFEINKYSYTICKILFPQAKIYHQAFEQRFIVNNDTVKRDVFFSSKYPQTGYDLVIGNPPYGDFTGKWAGMGEQSFTKAQTYVEYFITRGLDLVNSGGLLIYIVGVEVANGGKPFLAQGMTKAKEAIAEKAELLAAYRLPNGVFERTDVVCDIIVLRKK